MMERIATTLAAQSLARKGILIHGALAVRDGAGVILAGPSGVGKSFASRRLPLPWRSLSDDNALVVRDANGRYWAHPWPTWSLLRDNGPVESWPVEQAVPLKALLFLRHSPVDRAEQVALTSTTGLIMESAVQLARTVALTPEGDANRTICGKYLRAAWALAAAVPGYRLHISLTGQFWNEIERVLKDTEKMRNVECGVRMPRKGFRSHMVRRRSSATQQQKLSTEAPKLLNSPTQTRSTDSAADHGRPPASPGRSENQPVRFRLLYGLLPRALKPRLVRFQTRNRTFLKLVMGGRVVGSVNDVLREWHIRRPFRILIDERSLESPPPHEWQQGLLAASRPSEN